MNDLQLMKGIVAALEFEKDISDLCCQVRRVDESDLRTVERLVRERNETLRLLNDMGIRGRWEDPSFKDWPGPAAAIREHLEIGPDAPNTWHEQKTAKAQALEVETAEYADNMAKRWAERAAEIRARAMSTEERTTPLLDAGLPITAELQAEANRMHLDACKALGVSVVATGPSDPTDGLPWPWSSATYMRDGEMWVRFTDGSEERLAKIVDQYDLRHRTT